ncbi:MAG: Nif3-like dinuclear metal center hexameric protein [Ignavibacteriales bacterium]
MAVKAQQVFSVMEKLAPLSLAENWDNCGLQIGSPGQEINGICVSLDVDEALVDWVAKSEANLIVTHHPLFFHDFKTINYDTVQGNLIRKLVSYGIAVYSAHTNLDSAPNGLNQYLAEKLELKNIDVLGNMRMEKLYKLVVFVPDVHVEEVRQAINDSGAGFFGNYRDCSFRTPGTGTFRPLKGSQPYMGRRGILEQASEFRLETIVPEGILQQTVAAMLKAHPYEEVAYDIYPLLNKGRAMSYGRIGELPRPLTMKNLALRVKKKLNIENVRGVGDPSRPLKKIALASGAGSSMIPIAIAEGCDALITGDIKYHEAKDVEESGLVLLDAGHDSVEASMVDLVGEYLETAAEKGHWDISISRRVAAPVFKCL